MAPRPSRLRLSLVGAMAVAGSLVLAACGGNVSTPTETADVSGVLALEVPDFSISIYQGEDVLGGTEVTLSEILGQGKPVVLNFWAGLCPPCRAEMPDFQRVHEARGDDVTILGVDIGPFVGLGSRRDGRELLAELGIEYPAGTTFDQDIVGEFRVVGMPTTVFLYADGRLLSTWSGLLTEPKINEFVDRLLGS